MSTLRVRTLTRADVPAVRDICVATGRLRASQAPAQWMFARYWTDYYVRFEPAHALVAVDGGGRVLGYLTAAYDTLEYRRRMRRSVLPSIVLRAVVTGAIAHPPSRNFIVRRVAVWADPEPDPDNLLADYPAHIHINLLPEAQNKGGGTALMERFLSEAFKARIKGVHLETLAGNLQACRFFVKCGFKEVARRYPFKKLDPSQADRAVIVYARRIT